MNQSRMMDGMRRLCVGTLWVSLLIYCWLGSSAEGVDRRSAGFHGDVEFVRRGEVGLTLDAYVPEGKGPFPTCILVHGGGFIRGDKQSYIKPLFEPLGKAGFAWFTINYRLAPTNRWPACAEDVAEAVRWVKVHAAEYQVDPRRIALIGESAGGHLVSWHGAMGQGDTSVAAVVPFYAPHDLEFQVRQRQQLGDSMRGLLGLRDLDDEAWPVLRAASPSGQVRAGMPPYLLLHGDKDVQVPFEQSPRFQALMQAAGNRCDLERIAGGGHGMGGWSGLGVDYAQRIIDWLNGVWVSGGKLSLAERIAQVKAGCVHPDAVVRRLAVRSLAHSEMADELVGITGVALGDTDAEVREWAATVLGPRGRLAEEFVPRLVEQLVRDPEKRCRETAARALGRIGKASPENRSGVAALERAAKGDVDPVTRVVALGALALMSPEDDQHVDAVAKYLAHDDSLTRMKAAHALGYLGGRSSAAAPAIGKALTMSSDARERGYLARSLGQIGDRGQLATLLSEYRKERSEVAQGEMRVAIARLGGEVPR